MGEPDDFFRGEAEETYDETRPNSNQSLVVYISAERPTEDMTSRWSPYISIVVVRKITDVVL